MDGLTLGGGISFLSGTHGWACDGVRNCELVTANGTVLDVNHASFPELYWALRSGYNEFGIVTRFNYETFPQGQMWDGTFVSAVETNSTLLAAILDIADNGSQDPDGFAWVTFAYVQSVGIYVATTTIKYAQPVANPPILNNFNGVLNTSAIQSNVGQRTSAHWLVC